MTGWSQGPLKVDRTEIRIAEQIHATMQVDVSGSRVWSNADTFWPDTLHGIEIVKGPEWNKENLAAATVAWTIAIFDTGWVRIPSLPLIFTNGGQRDTLMSNDIPIHVLPVEPDSSGLRPIKDIYQQPFLPGYYKKYIPHLLVFLLMITGLVYWWKKRNREKRPPAFTPPPPAPEIWAYDALDALAEKRLWQSGEVKEHYSILTGILREYLERRYGIRAMEQVTDEILEQLRKLHLSSALLEDTAQLLSIADLIKFAKADPGIDIHAETIKRVRSFVQETTPVFRQEGPENENGTADEVVE
jgi:hypothetical protein